MKYTELKNDIAQGDRRIYLFEGEDAYFRTRGEEQVKAAFDREGIEIPYNHLNVHVIQNEKA